MISLGKRIFSRVEQECETEVQGWNGTVPKGGAKTGGASVGAEHDSGACEAGSREYGRGAGRRRWVEPRGCVREAGEGKVRAKRRDCSGERGSAEKSAAEGELEPGGEERKNAAGTEERTAALGKLNCPGAAEICRRGARRLRAGSCPRRKHCVRTRVAPQGQERLAFSFSIGKPGPLARAEILEWRTGRHNAKAAPQGQGGEA